MVNYQSIFRSVENVRAFLQENEKKPDFFKIIYDFFLALSSNPENFNLEEIKAIMLLDEAVQNMVEKKEAAFLVSANSLSYNKFGLTEQDKHLIIFFDILSTIYSELFIQSIKSNSKSLLLQLSSKTLSNLNRMIKWTIYDYGMLTESMWKRLNLTYLLCEKQDIVTEPVTPYPNAPETTLQDLFIQGHMLAFCANGFFDTAEIDLVHTILKKFSNRIHLQREPTSVACFTCTLNANRPAHLYLVDENINKADRFWSMNEITRILNQWRVNNMIGQGTSVLPSLKLASSSFVGKLLATWTKIDIQIEAKTYLDTPSPIVCLEGLDQLKLDFLGPDKSGQQRMLSQMETLTLSMEGDAPHSAPEIEKPELKIKPLFANMTAIGKASVDILHDLKDDEDVLKLYSLVSWQKMPKKGPQYYVVGFLNQLQREEAKKVKANIVLLGSKPILTSIALIDRSSSKTSSSKKFSVILCKTLNKKNQKYCIITDRQLNDLGSNWTIMLNNIAFNFEIKTTSHSGKGWYCLDIDILSEGISTSSAVKHTER